MRGNDDYGWHVTYINLQKAAREKRQFRWEQKKIHMKIPISLKASLARRCFLPVRAVCGSSQKNILCVLFL
jgi:hypothetical protein